MKKTILLTVLVLLASVGVWGQVPPRLDTAARPSLERDGWKLSTGLEINLTRSQVANFQAAVEKWQKDHPTDNPVEVRVCFDSECKILTFDEFLAKFGFSRTTWWKTGVKLSEVGVWNQPATITDPCASQAKKELVITAKRVKDVWPTQQPLSRPVSPYIDWNNTTTEAYDLPYPTRAGSPGVLTYRKTRHRHRAHRRHVRPKLIDIEPSDTVNGVVKLSPPPSKAHPVYVRFAHAQQHRPVKFFDIEGTNNPDLPLSIPVTSLRDDRYPDTQQQPQQRPTQPEQPTHVVTVRVPPGEAAEIRLVAKEMDALQAQIDALVKQQTEARQRRLQPIILRAAAKVIETDPSVNANELLGTPVTPDGDGFSWKVTRAGPDAAAAGPAKPTEKKP